MESPQKQLIDDANPSQAEVSSAPLKPLTIEQIEMEQEVYLAKPWGKYSRKLSIAMETTVPRPFILLDPAEESKLDQPGYAIGIMSELEKLVKPPDENLLQLVSVLHAYKCYRLNLPNSQGYETWDCEDLNEFIETDYQWLKPSSLLSIIRQWWNGFLHGLTDKKYGNLITAHDLLNFSFDKADDGSDLFERICHHFLSLVHHHSLIKYKAE